MAISNVIAHRIFRPSPDAPAQTQKSDTVFSLDGITEETLREMKLGFIKKLTKIHGQFSEDIGEYPFSQWLRGYCDKTLSFESFSHQSMQLFEQTLSTSDAMLDAFVFFVHETLQHENCLYIFITHHKQGQYLDGQLQLANAMLLDTDNVVLAGKINLTEWQSNDKQLCYLSLLVWRGEKDINDAFLHWLGFSNKANVKEQTDAFLDAVEHFVQTQPEPHAVETREKVDDNSISQYKAGKRVNIEALSEQVSQDDKQAFVDFVQQDHPKLQKEIIPDRGQLRQYVRISGRNDLLSMSFDSKCLGETIIYDETSDSLTITTIPAGLKSRLFKHIAKDRTEETT